jgi:tetratricopeptide (TPR) repeat protein
LEPDNARAWSSRGNALQQLEHYAQAVQSYDQALRTSPDDAHILSNRSISQWSSGDFAQALKSADLALAINPQLALTWSHRGNVLRALGRPQDALDSYDRAIALDGGDAQAHLNKSYCLLLAGRWREGWPLFEWRKRLDVPIAARSFSQPLWTGTQDLGGKTVFVYAEQGLGDTIQFFRYCALVQSRRAQVILAAQNGLVRLLKAAGSGVGIVNLDVVPPHFDYHIPLMSLPLAFNTVVETIPAGSPYLKAESGKVLEWAGIIGTRGFKIGIAWRGDDRGARKGRSFPLSSFEKLARLPSVRLISLQKDATGLELRTGATGMNLEIPGDRLDDGPDAFIDTAAIMQNLDLVITADTSIAHLAGALGVRTWIALKHLPDWRWLTDRADSPWYPSVTLYRQAVERDWASVFDQMEPSLAALLQR